MMSKKKKKRKEKELKQNSGRVCSFFVVAKIFDSFILLHLLFSFRFFFPVIFGDRHCRFSIIYFFLPFIYFYFIFACPLICTIFSSYLFIFGYFISVFSLSFFFCLTTQNKKVTMVTNWKFFFRLQSTPHFSSVLLCLFFSSFILFFSKSFLWIVKKYFSTVLNRFKLTVI